MTTCDDCGQMMLVPPGLTPQAMLSAHVCTCRHGHVWAYRSSMGDPYRVCEHCGRVEDVDQ